MTCSSSPGSRPGTSAGHSSACRWASWWGRRSTRCAFRPRRRASPSRLSLPSSLAAARANPEKLQRVLFNLIQNAIRHTPADGSVVVRATEVGEGIEVEVADTGPGIPPEEREHVFDAFFRGGADASARSGADGAGAGLGLAVSRAIVEAHGGRIWLADAPAGTRVRFSLSVTV